MDETDQKLIAALRRDARAALSDLALELGVSRATVRSRMQRLRRSGDIVGFTVVLKHDVFESPVRGLMLLEIEGRATERVVSRLNGIAEVTAIHTTNGRWDLVVELGADTLADFDEILRRIRLIDGIAGSETSLLLASRRSTRARAGGGAAVASVSGRA